MRRGNPYPLSLRASAHTGVAIRNPLPPRAAHGFAMQKKTDCHVGPLGLLAMTSFLGADSSTRCRSLRMTPQGKTDCHVGLFGLLAMTGNYGSPRSFAAGNDIELSMKTGVPGGGTPVLYGIMPGGQSRQRRAYTGGRRYPPAAPHPRRPSRRSGTRSPSFRYRAWA